MSDRLEIAVPPDLQERIAERAAELVLERLGRANDNGDQPCYLTPAAAGRYIGKPRQRIYDLLSAGRLTRFKDGSSTLVSVAELDDYVAGKATGPRATA